MHRRLLLAAGLLCLGAGAGVAQTAPSTRVRGTIAAIEGSSMTVTSRDGQTLAVALAEPLTVVTVKKVDLAALKVNDYVGIASRTGPDGKPMAIEVLLLPEAARGAGEGHYAWDLEPGSMMTNGTIKGAVTAVSGRELLVAFKDSSHTISVPEAAPVVTLAPAERTDLKPGASVFFSATKSAEGALSVSRIVVGKDGVAPPM